MPMRDTIVAIAKHILERISADDRHGFSPITVETDYDLGRHRGFDRGRAEQEKFDRLAWESVLFSRKFPAGKELLVVLEYPIDHAYNNSGTQAISIHGHDYTAVRLFIYDRGTTPCPVVKQNVINNLTELFPPVHNDLYIVVNSNQKKDSGEYGHVLNLLINDTGNSWNIGANLTPAQIEQASKQLVDAAVAALKYLLPVAQYYFENRDVVLRSAQ